MLKKRRNKEIRKEEITNGELMSRPKFLKNLKLGWHLLSDI